MTHRRTDGQNKGRQAGDTDTGLTDPPHRHTDTEEASLTLHTVGGEESDVPGLQRVVVGEVWGSGLGL